LRHAVADVALLIVLLTLRLSNYGRNIFLAEAGFGFTSVLLQNTIESFPLAARFDPIYCGFSRHRRVFLIDNIEIMRRAEDEPWHRIDGS